MLLLIPTALRVAAAGGGTPGRLNQSGSCGSSRTLGRGHTSTQRGQGGAAAAAAQALGAGVEVRVEALSVAVPAPALVPWDPLAVLLRLAPWAPQVPAAVWRTAAALPQPSLPTVLRPPLPKARPPLAQRLQRRAPRVGACVPRGCSRWRGRLRSPRWRRRGRRPHARGLPRRTRPVARAGQRLLAAAAVGAA